MKFYNFKNLWVFSLVGLFFFLAFKLNVPSIIAADKVSTFSATEDAYVDSAAPTTNKGTGTSMWIDASPSVKRGLIRFDFSTLPTDAVISAATLKLFISTDGSSVSGNVNAVGGLWSQKTVTFANSPAVGAQIASLPNPGTANSSVLTDVTSEVIGKTAVDFYLTTPNSDGIVYYTHEKGVSYAPQLVISWSSGSTQSHTPTPSPSPTPVPTPTPFPTPAPTPTPGPTPSPTPTPTPTPLPGSSDPTLMAAGDIVCNGLLPTSSSCQQMAVSQIIVDLAPTFALTLGDNCHTPSVECYNNYFDASWGRFKNILNPISGNHDYLVTGAVNYYDYFNGVGNFTGPAGDRDKGYYSFDVGSWHLVTLNTQCSQVGGCGTSSPQYKWLESDLKAHSNQCTLAYWHIPLFSSGGRANNNSKALFTLLYNYNADIVLNGHDHIYERFAPQKYDGTPDPARGIREFIVGTGGANHTSIASVKPNSEVRNTDTFGALKLTLHADSYDWQFVPVAGKTFTDSGTASCH